MNIKINEILPNPFRNLEHYEISRRKVETLKNSYQTSEYWPIIIVRKNKDGRYESAYGEHRKTAFRELYGDTAEIQVIVLNLSDEAMIRMMANENGEWNSDFLVVIETIDAVVKGYAAGRFKLPKPGKSERYVNGDKRFPYSSMSIAQFLGWLKPSGRASEKVINAIAALDLINDKVLKLSHFFELSSKQADALIREVRIAQKRAKGDKELRKADLEKAEHEAREAKERSDDEAYKAAEKKKHDLKASIGKADKLVSAVSDRVSQSMKTGEVGCEKVRKVTNDLSEKMVTKVIPPDVDFINHLCREIAELMDPNFDRIRTGKIQAVVSNKLELDARYVARVGKVLIGLSERCLRYAAQLSTPHVEKIIGHTLSELPER